MKEERKEFFKRAEEESIKSIRDIFASLMMAEDYSKELNADLTSYELTHEKMLSKFNPNRPDFEEFKAEHDKKLEWDDYEMYIYVLQDYCESLEVTKNYLLDNNKELIRRVGQVETHTDKLNQIINRAIEYINSEMSPYTIQGEDGYHEWTKEEIKEFLWDDDEWR